MTSDIRNNNPSDKIRTALNNTSQAQRQIDSSKKGKKQISIDLNALHYISKFATYEENDHIELIL